MKVDLNNIDLTMVEVEYRFALNEWKQIMDKLKSQTDEIVEKAINEAVAEWLKTKQ